VVHGLRNAYNSQFMTAPFGFLEELISAALSAIPANREQHVHAAANQIIHGDSNIHWSARSAEHGAAFLMDFGDEGGSENNRLLAACGIQALVTTAKSEHGRNAVSVMQFKEKGANYIVQARAQASTSHDAGTGLLGIKINFGTRSGQLEDLPFGL